MRYTYDMRYRDAMRTVFAGEHFLFGALNKVSSIDCDARVWFTFKLTLSQSLYEGSPQLQNNGAINLCGVLTLHSILLDLSLLSTFSHSFRPLSLVFFFNFQFLFLIFYLLPCAVTDKSTSPSFIRLVNGHFKQDKFTIGLASYSEITVLLSAFFSC